MWKKQLQIERGAHKKCQPAPEHLGNKKQAFQDMLRVIFPFHFQEQEGMIQLMVEKPQWISVKLSEAQRRFSTFGILGAEGHKETTDLLRDSDESFINTIMLDI